MFWNIIIFVSDVGQYMLLYIASVVFLFFILLFFYKKRIKRKTADWESRINQNYSLLKKALHYSAFNHENITELFQPFLSEKGNEVYKKLKMLLKNYNNYLTENYITIDNEIKMIIDFMEIEKIRKKEGFNYEIKTSNNLIFNEIQVPSMVLLPIIANMTRQSFSTGTSIKIELIRMLNNDLKVQITSIFISKIKEIESDQQMQEVIANLKGMISHLAKDEKLNIKQYVLGTPEDDHIGLSMEIIIPSKIIRYIENKPVASK